MILHEGEYSGQLEGSLCVWCQYSGKMNTNSLAWTMDVNTVDAVLKSSMGRNLSYRQSHSSSASKRYLKDAM